VDIGSFNIDHLNFANNPFSPSMPLAPGFRSGEPGAFEDMLRRAQSSQASTQPAGSRLPGSAQIDRTSELYELCLELETILIRNLVKGMRNTVQKSNLIDTGFAGEIYEDMLYDEYAKIMARNASFGFAEMAYRELAGQR
jgi:flagellar protein FlgJ